jgi:hypothetical protein
MILSATFHASNQLFFLLKLAYIDLEITNIEQTAGDTKFIDGTLLKVKRTVVNGIKTRTASGPFIINEPIDVTHLLEINTYKKQGGQYRLMPYKLPIMTFCDFLNTDVTFIPAWMEASNMTRPLGCPIPKVFSLVFIQFRSVCFRSDHLPND